MDWSILICPFTLQSPSLLHPFVAPTKNVSPKTLIARRIQHQSTMARSHQHVHKKRVDRREPRPVAMPMPHPFQLVDEEQDSLLLERDPTLVDRSPPGSSQETAASATSDISSAATHTCPPGDNSSICQRPTDSTSSTTIPIVCGAV